MYRQLVTGNWVGFEVEKGEVEDDEMDYMGETTPEFDSKMTKSKL